MNPKSALGAIEDMKMRKAHPELHDPMANREVWENDARLRAFARMD